MEYGFTAAMEDELDAVSRGEEDWTTPLEKFWKPFIHQVEKIEKTVTREQVAQARELGKDPATGKPVTVRMGRFGPFVQIGTKDDEEKPRFAGLRPGQKMDHITLADAMELFKLPRTLGETAAGETIVTNVGRFGPYVKYGSKYVSLKEDDPVHGDARARARGDPPQAGGRCEPAHPGFPGRRHPGAERPLRPVHHGQEEERQDPQGSRSEDADARGVPRAARGGARARRSLRPLGPGPQGRRARRRGAGCSGGRHAGHRGPQEGRRQGEQWRRGRGARAPAARSPASKAAAHGAPAAAGNGRAKSPPRAARKHAAAKTRKAPLRKARATPKASVSRTRGAK